MSLLLKNVSYLILCLAFPMLPVSLYCQFLIVPSVFSNVHLNRPINSGLWYAILLPGKTIFGSSVLPFFFRILVFNTIYLQDACLLIIPRRWSRISPTPPENMDWHRIWYCSSFSFLCIVLKIIVYPFFLFFSFDHCVVCSFSIYGFWLPFWYLQDVLANVAWHTLSRPRIV